VKPRIGISAFPRVVPATIGPTLVHGTSRFYVDAVRRAGAVPLVFPVIDPDDVESLLAVVDGLILTGGGDVDPARYGAEPHPETYGVDDARDAIEFRLLQVALDEGLPVLATCRGLQVANVALGGTLVQHLPMVTESEHRQFGRWQEGVHRVRIDPDSRLARLLGRTDVEVNSLHHQAVATPAPGLRPVAWAEDGVVEAVEPVGDERLVAVQWHPELHENAPAQQGLFGNLVAQATEVAARSS
jgi:putative glutamine amidotransferase